METKYTPGGKIANDFVMISKRRAGEKRCTRYFSETSASGSISSIHLMAFLQKTVYLEGTTGLFSYWRWYLQPLFLCKYSCVAAYFIRPRLLSVWKHPMVHTPQH